MRWNARGRREPCLLTEHVAYAHAFRPERASSTQHRQRHERRRHQEPRHERRRDEVDTREHRRARPDARDVHAECTDPKLYWRLVRRITTTTPVELRVRFYLVGHLLPHHAALIAVERTLLLSDVAPRARHPRGNRWEGRLIALGRRRHPCRPLRLCRRRRGRRWAGRAVSVRPRRVSYRLVHGRRLPGEWRAFGARVRAGRCSRWTGARRRWTSLRTRP